MSEILDPAKRPPKPKSEIPHLFGRGGRDRLLLCLAVNGPMTVREVGRATNIDSRKAFDMVGYLLKTGLVVKRDRPGGRKYVAINRKLTAWAELTNLLETLAKAFPAQAVPTIQKRWHLQIDNGELTPDRLDHAFFSPVRSRVLLLIAAAGIVMEKDLYNLLGLGAVSTLYAINHWQREGIVESRYVATARLLSLNPSWVAAHELRMLLGAMTIDDPENLYLGKEARERAERFIAAHPAKKKHRHK